MGSSVILDYIGSTITFGILIVTVMRLNGSASQNNYAYTQNYLLQRNMIVLTTMLEDDLRHVGVGIYNVDSMGTGGVLYANFRDIKFRADLPPQDGKIDTIEWKLDTVTQVYSAPLNTRIRYLYRIVNSQSQKLGLGVTDFSIRYWNVYDANQEIPSTNFPLTPTSAVSTGNIGPVSVSIRLESASRWTGMYMAATDTSEYQMLWRQIRTISRNNRVQYIQ